MKELLPLLKVIEIVLPSREAWRTSGLLFRNVTAAETAWSSAASSVLLSVSALAALTTAVSVSFGGGPNEVATGCMGFWATSDPAAAWWPYGTSNTELARTRTKIAKSKSRVWRLMIRIDNRLGQEVVYSTLSNSSGSVLVCCCSGKTAREKLGAAVPISRIKSTGVQ